MSIDPLAWVAIGFLGVVVVTTGGLLWWVMKKVGKQAGEL